MDDVIEIIGDVAEPVVDSLQEWGSDAVEYLKGHAPQYLRYVVSSSITMNMTSAMVKSQDRWLYSVRKNTKLHTP